MKNYKFLAPVILIVLFGLSVYRVVDGNKNVQKEFEAAVKEARAYAEDGIQIYAVECYEKALALKPSLSLYLELGEYYKSFEDSNKAIDWGEIILKKYPQEPEAYCFLMEIYQENQDYLACFRLYDTFTKRKLQSAAVENIISEMEYSFYYAGEYAEVSAYSGGYCAVRTKELWGYVNERGTSVIGARYQKPGIFASGKAAVLDNKGEAYYIDEAGNKIAGVKNVKNIEQLGMMENDVFSAYDGESWSYYEKNGEKLFGGFENASMLANGVAAAQKDGKWAIYDASGGRLSKDAYDSVLIDEKGVASRNDRLFVELDGKILLIDSVGNQIGENTYEDAKLFNDTTYAAVEQNGKWGFIDTDGNWMIEPRYEDARSFSNGFAAVKMDGRWGFINAEQEICIDCEFEDAKDFNSSGCVFVYQYGIWSLLKLYSYNH